MIAFIPIYWLPVHPGDMTIPDAFPKDADMPDDDVSAQRDDAPDMAST